MFTLLASACFLEPPPPAPPADEASKAVSTDPTCPPDMAWIAAGQATLGITKRTRPWQGVATLVDLPTFCIDLHEYPNRPAALPKTEVTWEEARDLCTATGKRLCRSAEWERACRGRNGWEYSYGPQFDAKRCNTPGIGRDAPPSGPPPIVPSGSKADCKSPEGVFDLNGNVSEWVEDAWDVDIYGIPEVLHLARTLSDAAPTPPEPPPTSWQDGTFRELRGGTMWSETFYGQSCHSRHPHPRSARSDDDGFRCCATPTMP